MTTKTLNIQVDPHEVQILLDRLKLILQPTTLEEFLRVGAAPVLKERAVERFNQEGDDASGKWAPLRFSTQNIRFFEGHNPVWPINVRTGDLRNYVTESNGLALGNGEGATLEWPWPDPSGELMAKFITAQKGKGAQARFTAGSGFVSQNAAFGATVPRPVVAADETDAELIVSALRLWFATEIARGGHF